MGEIKMRLEQDISSAGKGVTVGAGFLAAYGLTLNEIIGYLTVFYLIAQIAYLFWKWRRELKSKACD
jgi:hypothetical protein